MFCHLRGTTPLYFGSGGFLPLKPHSSSAPFKGDTPWKSPVHYVFEVLLIWTVGFIFQVCVYANLVVSLVELRLKINLKAKHKHKIIGTGQFFKRLWFYEFFHKFEPHISLLDIYVRISFFLYLFADFLKKFTKDSRVKHGNDGFAFWLILRI